MLKKKGKGVVHISNLFKKYTQTLKAPQGTVITQFIESVECVLHIPIKKEQCSYNVSTKTISLHTPGMVKTEILLHKEEILTALKHTLGEKSAPQNIL